MGLKVGKLAMSESRPWGYRHCSSYPQSQIQSALLSHSNIHPIYERLKLVKRAVLQIQIDRISTTKGNSRISQMSPRADLVLMVLQKLEASN